MTFMALLMLAAAQTGPPAAPPPVNCADADHRALDFWVGDWDVLPAGSTTVVAKSEIKKIVGCAISESYHQTVGPGGTAIEYHGRSISSYVVPDKEWRQFYVDNAGRAATLTGPWRKGAVILSQRTPAGLTRMTILANPDGTVRQHGELSKDDGKSWSTSFDFIYRRR